MGTSHCEESSVFLLTLGVAGFGALGVGINHPCFGEKDDSTKMGTPRWCSWYFHELRRRDGVVLRCFDREVF